MEEDENVDSDNEFTDYGSIQCTLFGTYVGPQLAEIWVSGGYGKSVNDPDSVYIDSLGQPYHIHTLAEITDISDSTGGDNGGQTLTITGTGFDKTEGETMVSKILC